MVDIVLIPLMLGEVFDQNNSSSDLSNKLELNCSINFRLLRTFFASKSHQRNSGHANALVWRKTSVLSYNDSTKWYRLGFAVCLTSVGCRPIPETGP